VAESFISELKRRNVFKVGVAYLVLAWVVVQIADTAVPALHLPEWIITAVFFFGAIGFPFALFFAWLFEITPDGIKKESDISPEDSITVHTGEKINYIIIGLLVVALAYFINENQERTKTNRNIIDKTVAQNDISKGKSQVADTPSIAVLPFINMSSDKEQEYFSDGLSEEILNLLVKIPNLRVIARTSSFYFKGKDIKVSVTVGMVITDHPPYRSGRALLTHPAPTSGIWRKSVVQGKDEQS